MLRHTFVDQGTVAVSGTKEEMNDDAKVNAYLVEIGIPSYQYRDDAPDSTGITRLYSFES